jgi:hypothetical protein
MTEAERKEIALKAREARNDGDFVEAALLWGHLSQHETIPQYQAYAAEQAKRCQQMCWERNGQ